MHSVKKVEKESPLPFLSQNTMIISDSMVLIGKSVSTDQRKYFFKQGIINVGFITA